MPAISFFSGSSRLFLSKLTARPRRLAAFCVLAGLLYALFTRVAFAAMPGLSLMSFAYFCAAPAGLGALFAGVYLYFGLKFKPQTPLIPLYAVTGFGAVTFAAGLEAIFCLLILALPFIVIGIAAFLIIFFGVKLFRKYRPKETQSRSAKEQLKQSELLEETERENNRLRLEAEEAERKKREEDALWLIPFAILVPMGVGQIESRIPTEFETYRVETQTVVDAPPETVWQTVTRVGQLREGEIDPTFFSAMGIPRPLAADDWNVGLGKTRVAHFENGLKFNETISEWQFARKIQFDIEIDPASVRQTVFEQHVLKGGYFRISSAAYRLTPLPEGKTLLTLSSAYQLKSNFNAYPKWWGDWALNDFQTRILKVMQNRSETRQKTTDNPLFSATLDHDFHGVKQNLQVEP